MNLQRITLSKKSTLTVMHDMVPILKCLNFKMSTCQMLGIGGGGPSYKRNGEKSFGDGTVLDLDCGGRPTNLCI